jgi:hypothetical protein
LSARLPTAHSRIAAARQKTHLCQNFPLVLKIRYVR